jgi:hypothetical protein
MLPEPIVCLRCAFPLTVRLGARRVCFQCRFSWFLAASKPVTTPEKVDAYPFTPQELARLQIYRLAVQARFFSDDSDDLEADS